MGLEAAQKIPAQAGVSKQIDIQYFAILRDERGLDRETVQTEAISAMELFEELAVRHGFGLRANFFRVAINDEFTSWETALRSGDRVVFIPPVAGG